MVFISSKSLFFITILFGISTCSIGSRISSKNRIFFGIGGGCRAKVSNSRCFRCCSNNSSIFLMAWSFISSLKFTSIFGTSGLRSWSYSCCRASYSETNLWDSKVFFSKFDEYCGRSINVV